MTTEQMVKKLENEIENIEHSDPPMWQEADVANHLKRVMQQSLEVIQTLDEENKFLRQNQKEDWF